MAKLLSEDTNVPCAFEIKKLDIHQEGGQSWNSIQVNLTCGDKTIALGKNNGKEACMLCRSPHDEAFELLNLLGDLADDKRNKALFEPTEPSFEISLERTIEGGITVHAWIDSSNSSTGFYSWDAMGVRFFTTSQHLLKFIEDLQSEFSLSRTYP